MKTFVSVVVIPLLLSACANAADQTIVCIGDSITLGVHLELSEAYPAILQTLRPNDTVINAGVGGNTSGAGLARFNSDVLSYNPDYVVILFGTNDSVMDDYDTFAVSLNTFSGNLAQMIQKTRDADATPILCTLLPVLDEVYYTRHPEEYYLPYGGIDGVLQDYRQATLDVAGAYGVSCVDFYSIFAADMSMIRPAPDGVHPTAVGTVAMADAVNNEIPEPLTGVIMALFGSAVLLKRKTKKI